MQNNTFSSLSRDKWYKITIVYSINNYVSFKLQECDENGNLTDVGFCSGVPSKDGLTTVGYVGLSTKTKNSEIIAHLDDVSWTQVQPSSGLVITIDGEDSFEKETLELVSKQYEISEVLHNQEDGIIIPGNTIGAVWSLEDTDGQSVDQETGFTIDQTGLLTANASTVEGTYNYNVVVKSGDATNGYTTEVKPITITVKPSTAAYRDVSIKYMDNVRNVEVKEKRIIPAQRDGTTVSIDPSDRETFVAITEGKKYKYDFYEEESVISIEVGEGKTELVLNFVPTLMVDVKINFIDKETGETIKTSATVVDLLDKTTYNVDDQYKATIVNGKDVYVLDSDNELAYEVKEDLEISLNFNKLDDEYFFYEDFESYDINSLGGFGGSASDCLVIDSASVNGSGKALRFVSGSNNSRISTKSLTTPVELGAKVTVEFDFYGGTRYSSSSGVGSDVTLIDESGKSILTIEQQDARLGYYWGGAARIDRPDPHWGVNENQGQCLPISEDISGANKWYHVKAVINKPAHVMTITVTDPSGISDEINVDITEMASSSINTVRVAADKSNTSYVDNIKIYKKAGEYLIQSFTSGSMDIWEKVSGTPTFTYGQHDGVPYVEVNGESTLKSPAFGAKKSVFAEYDANIEDGNFISTIVTDKGNISYGFKDNEFVVNGTAVQMKCTDGDGRPDVVDDYNIVYADDKVSALVENDTAKEINAILYIAEYNTDGTLNRVVMSDEVKIAVGETQSISKDFVLAEGKMLNAFVWDDMNPIMPSYQAEREENNWYTIAASINTETNTANFAYLYDEYIYESGEMSINSTEEGFTITNIEFNTPTLSKISELKIIEGEPVKLVIDRASTEVLNVELISRVAGFHAVAEYKVPVKIPMADFEWTLEAGNYTGLELSDEGRSAFLTAQPEAKAQIVTVKVSNGRFSDEKPVKIVTSANNVIFETYSNNALIPFDGEKTVAFTAKAVNGNMEPLNRTISYSLCDDKYESINPTGISIDESTGELKVLPTAEETTVYVMAKSTDDGEEIYEVVKVLVHGYKFDLGYANTPDTVNVKEGYVGIATDSTYSEAQGYGFTSASTSVIEPKKGTSTDLLIGDYIGSDSVFRFKVDLPNGEYQVKSVHRGTIFTSAPTEEEIARNSSLAVLFGESKTSIQSETLLSEATFTASVINNVLELKFDTAVDRNYIQGDDKEVIDINIKPAAASIEITKLRDLPTESDRREKPNWYIVGDSTADNSGDNCGYANVAQTYTGNNATVVNRGNAGRSLLSYFCQNRFENIMADIVPGDIVTLGMGINYRGENTDTFIYEMNYLIKGIKQRGGIPIVVSPTPRGFVGDGYNAGSGLYEYRAYAHNYEKIANDNNVAYIDLTKIGADALNADLEERFSSDLTAREAYVKTFWNDGNHMTKTGANFVAEVLVNEMKKIVELGWI